MHSLLDSLERELDRYNAQFIELLRNFESAPDWLDKIVECGIHLNTLEQAIANVDNLIN